MRQELSAIAFHDVRKAEANLARLEQRLPSALQEPLASLLVNSPDPDGALNLLERWSGAASPEILAELSQQPTALNYLIAVFGYSELLAESFLSDPALAVQFARDRNFIKLKSVDDLMQDYARFSTTSPAPWLSSQLARFKRRNHLRIVLKDVLRLSTLGEATFELSALADVVLRYVLTYCDRELEERYGRPQYRDGQGRIARSGFSVVSLGKLGGNELNYSSDIDLLFLYAHGGDTSGGSEQDSVISNKEYFVRLAHAVVRAITQSTPHGEVFRVDVRLRPEGEQGDLAISLESALEYYEHRAREWELQMLIKARHSAGDPKLTRELLRGVEPYIYGRSTDFQAVESVLEKRDKLSRKMRESRGEAIDVELHRGGIRDIEFLTQCLQRLHGAREPWVRSGGTLFALRKLYDKGAIADRDYAALTSAYEFLRKVEHRAQLQGGNETHRLPVEPDALDRLARRVGTEASPPERPGSLLRTEIERTFSAVNEIYRRLLHPRAAAASQGAFDLKPLPEWSGEHDPHSFEGTLALLEAHAPNLARVARDVAVPDRARRNVRRFLASLLASPDRFRLARGEPEKVRRALQVIGASDYFAELLVHHPEELLLMDSAGPISSAYSREIEARQMRLGVDEPQRAFDVAPFPWATEPGVDTGEKMAILRRHSRACVVTLGDADLMALDSVFRAFGRWSTFAARSISSALSIAAEALGRPSDSQEMPLAVVALGRLGLNEFDLASDADLLFVAEAGMGRENAGVMTRLAEKTIEVVSSYTRDGTLFAVDTRFGPRGREGELVLTEDALMNYVYENANAWEALTYLKARPVAGGLALGHRLVRRLVEACLERFSSYVGLEGEIQETRRRLEREFSVPASNPKTAPGGIYDVDFAVSFLRLRHRLNLPPGTNLFEQVEALRRASFITEDDATALAAGATLLRSFDHATRLVTGNAAEGLPDNVGHAEAVESLLHRWGILPEKESLPHSLRETQHQLRSVYRRILGCK